MFRPKIYTQPVRMYWDRIGTYHAHKDGSPVLKEDSSWRTISGIYVRVGKKLIVLQWRGMT